MPRSMPIRPWAVLERIGSRARIPGWRDGGPGGRELQDDGDVVFATYAPNAAGDKPRRRSPSPRVAAASASRPAVNEAVTRGNVIGWPPGAGGGSRRRLLCRVEAAAPSSANQSAAIVPNEKQSPTRIATTHCVAVSRSLSARGTVPTEQTCTQHASPLSCASGLRRGSSTSSSRSAVYGYDDLSATIKHSSDTVSATGPSKKFSQRLAEAKLPNALNASNPTSAHVPHRKSADAPLQ